MARILLSLSNAYEFQGEYRLTGMYDQIATSLKECGNDVLIFIPNIFNKAVFASDNKLLPYVSESSLRTEIKEFNPDLVISFNNANYEKILEISDCPIIIWGADLENYWNQKELIKKNIDRYWFFCFSKAEIRKRKEIFEISDDRIFNIPPATNLKNTDSMKTTNISFIGTMFGVNSIFLKLIEKYSGNNELTNLLNKINKDPFIKKEDLLKSFKDEDIFKKDFSKIDETQYVDIFSREQRIKTLLLISDLGLDLYGDRGWMRLKEYLPSLSACFKQDIIYSAKQNEEIYNSSKICLNIAHAQSSQGMSFRVCDIMASGGCLVSSFSPMIQETFKDSVEIPFFENNFETRKWCEKLLKDDFLRKEIVLKSNIAIEDNHRWHHRFKAIEKIFKVSLINDEAGNIKILKPLKEYELIYKILDIKNIKYKIFYKMWKFLDKKLSKRGMI